MRAIIQRVSEARVVIEQQVVGQIAHGLLVLLGVGVNDNTEDARLLAQKLAKLRIFADDAGKMNRSLSEVQGSVLSISQFTLYAELHNGNRPSFFEVGSPDIAKALYEHFNAELKALNIHVQTGIFGANMQIELINDGPVTFFLDSKAIGKR